MVMVSEEENVMIIEFSSYGIRIFGRMLAEKGRFYRILLSDGRETWIGESQIIRKTRED
jgi:hypothetical protein